MRFFKLIYCVGAASAISLKTQADVQLNSFMQLSIDQRETILNQIKNGQQVDAKWGFLKNIVNIDRFFSSGTSASSSSYTPPPPPPTPTPAPQPPQPAPTPPPAEPEEPEEQEQP